ncbi:MAG: tRNA (adenosine(37)-N6)-threonylcarbamoyltransferase complex transferase subunit TsaD [Verrucomicrobiae bacterium]|nr:tRNA (adenosine(37)-N6)-threonylcarbamoyltransferase complex transferase subunit TsaD [Verrucomicrobiae bacterium]
MPALLAIETSCDETAAAVVRDGAILSSIVASQAKLHAPYGGVVPEIASRQHLRSVDALVLEALKQARVSPTALDAVAVTRGPGLPSALLVGVAAARGLALRLGKPLLPIHHIEAHLYSAPVAAPFVALVVSGGHTLLVHVARVGSHRLLGRTLDDAAGEAFDKVAQLLGLGYPGGPAIEKVACNGNPKAYDFPRPMLKSGDWNFSFSGLKTALRRAAAQPRTARADQPPEETTADLAASFQAAVVEILVEKTLRAARAREVRAVSVSGGVACNGALKVAFEAACRRENLALGWAERALCTDNAAMIGRLAARKLAAGAPIPEDWDIAPDWTLPEE